MVVPEGEEDEGASGNITQEDRTQPKNIGTIKKSPLVRYPVLLIL